MRAWRVSPYSILIFIAILAAPEKLDAADKWLSVRSRNFLLVGNASESQIKRVGRDLDEFRAGFTTLFPAAARETDPITVIVFKNDMPFRPFKPVVNGNVQLHSDHPESIEFVSYVSSVSNSITCGPVTPELPVLVVYRKGEYPAYFGEPVRVEFLDKK